MYRLRVCPSPPLASLVSRLSSFLNLFSPSDSKLAHRRDNRGPPSGGAGGPGGDVYIQADYNVHSLADVMRNVHAGAGGNGMGDSLKGQKGQDVTVSTLSSYSLGAR